MLLLLAASRLRLQLTEVVPRLDGQISAAEKARPERNENPGRERLWHSKHFVWYSLPPLQVRVGLWTTFIVLRAAF